MTKAPIAVLGIDLGKNSCSLTRLDATGALLMRKRLTRDAIVAFAATLPPCVIAMEACCGAHFLGRTLALHGHAIRLMSPKYVQPYVKAQKTDDRDAEAIAEVRRSTASCLNASGNTRRRVPIEQSSEARKS